MKCECQKQLKALRQEQLNFQKTFYPIYMLRQHPSFIYFEDPTTSYKHYIKPIACLREKLDKLEEVLMTLKGLNREIILLKKKNPHDLSL